MKRKILIFGILITFIVGAFLQNTLSFAQASSGGLEVEYLGADLDGPIFEIYNMLPGDCVERQVTVKNLGDDNLEVFVRTDDEVDSDNLATQMDWEIKRGATVLLTGILKSFYADADGITLGNFSGNQMDMITFKACFKTTAGNEYQNTLTKFDLVFWSKKGHSTQLPQECKNMKIKKFIVGNDSNNTLYGTNSPDFIDGRGGDDKIYGGNEGDCIFGGTGKDKLYGENSDDIIVAGLGDDFADGGNGKDKIWGNEDKDDLRGENGDDYLNGGAGIDKLNGGLSKDKCEQGESVTACES